MASTSVPAASPSAPLAPASAAELYRQADVELANVGAEVLDELVSYLEHPNPYVRAGALTRLSPNAMRLTAAALKSVVERLGDHERIVAEPCLPYESSRRAPMGQGMMFVAAECAHNHRVSIPALATSVIERAEPNALARAGVLAQSKDRNLLGMLEPVVLSRAAELTGPLEGVLVAAESRGKGAEIDAALALLARGTLGVGRAETFAALRRIASGSPAVRTLNALCVSLSLGYPGASGKRSDAANEAYAKVRSLLLSSCEEGPSCVPRWEVLSALRQMRAAAAPLLPDLVSLLDEPDEEGGAPIQVLMVLANMGEAARPAIPKVRSLLVRKPASDDDDVFSRASLLDVIGAARPSPESVMPAIMTAVRRHPRLYDEAAAVLVTLKARLMPGQRALLRRSYVEACADAGSIANFSFSRDERCFLASQNLKKLKVLPADF